MRFSQIPHAKLLQKNNMLFHQNYHMRNWYKKQHANSSKIITCEIVIKKTTCDFKMREDDLTAEIVAYVMYDKGICTVPFTYIYI